MATTRSLRAAFIAAAGATLVWGSAWAATPPSGTVTESSQATWTGQPLVPTASAECGGPNDPGCDNFRLTVVPPSFAFRVEIILTPQLKDDYDLQVYGPDGQLLDGSGNFPGQSESVVLSNPAAGVYTVSASPYAAALPYSAVARIVPHPTPEPSGEISPTYANYAAPAGVGTNAGEPTLGVNERTGAVMYIAGTETLKVDFNQCFSPAQASWTDESFVTTSQTTFDPIVFTDQPLGRSFVSQLLPSKVSLMAFTDNDGLIWTPSQGAGINSGVDHQTVGGGPFSSGGPQRPATQYPNAVYYCSQDLAYANCALSLDGGLTFGPAVPMYTLDECGGIHGHIKVAPDGTVYVPNPGCGAEQGLAVSTDNGLTWRVHKVPGSHAAGSDPSVAVASDGTVYFGWADADQHPYVAVSHDRGETWSNIMNVGTTVQGLPFNIENTAFPAMVAGDGDRAAMAFLGSPTVGNGAGDDPRFPAEWHLYIAHTYDGGRTWVTVNATPGDPVQRGTICQAGIDCALTRNLLDFNDATLDAEGRVLASYADGCIGSCLQGPPNSYSAEARIARQVTGKRLYSRFDLPTQSGAPGTPITEAVRDGSKVVVSWGTPDDHGSPITSYRIYRRTSSEPYKRLRQVYPTDHTFTDLYANQPGVDYFYYVTAVNARGESSFCGEVEPVVPEPEPAIPVSCVPPGRQVLTDESGDAPVAALDVESLSIAEPSSDDGSHKLVFTLKVKDLQTTTPGNAWMILWNRPYPDVDHDRNYVVLRATGLGTAEAKYGKISPPNVNQATDLGDADAGSYTRDGTITITLDTRKADDVQPPWDIFGLEVRTFAANASGLPVSQATAVDFTASGTYSLEGTAVCQNSAPVAADDSATTQGTPVVLAVLANDSDPDGDSLRVVSLTSPQNGKAVSRRDGRLSYNPNKGFVGTDTFTYTIDDGKGHTATGRVTVTVTR